MVMIGSMVLDSDWVEEVLDELGAGRVADVSPSQVREVVMDFLADHHAYSSDNYVVAMARVGKAVSRPEDFESGVVWSNWESWRDWAQMA